VGDASYAFIGEILQNELSIRTPNHARTLGDISASKWFIPPTPAIGSNRHAETQDPKTVEKTCFGSLETAN